MNSISKFSFYTGIHLSRWHRLGIVALLLAAVSYEILDSGLSRLFLRPVVEVVDESDEVGFRPAECWFTPESDWPEADCYYVQVPEVHGEPDARVIAFPVVIFHADAFFRYKNPVLHLGGGGPGAAMQLDSNESMNRVWRYFSRVSIEQGRDLYVIDPRGAGLSQPSLTCNESLEKAREWLALNLTWKEEQRRYQRAYSDCIERYRATGIRLAEYNSTSVARDMEIMRERSNVDQWVLYGASYAALYAQVIAQEFPDSVETMVLDSAVMIGRTGNVGFLKRAKAPYEMITRQCQEDSVCSGHPRSFMERIEALRMQFDRAPIVMESKDPYTGENLQWILNGNRFMSVFSLAIYYREFVLEVVSVIRDLEQNQLESFEPYVENYLWFALDNQFGDISMEAHYCHETKPFFKVERARRLVNRELQGLARHLTLKILEYPDYCEAIGNKEPNAVLSEGLPTEIPTLFLHGRLDVVTPIDDVIAQKYLFENSVLLRYDVGHGVFNAHECAHYVAARFVDNPDIPGWRLHCE